MATSLILLCTLLIIVAVLFTGYFIILQINKRADILESCAVYSEAAEMDSEYLDTTLRESLYRQMAKGYEEGSKKGD